MTDAALSLPASAPRRLSEDWLSVIVGLGVLILALASLAGPDLLGWAVTTSVWNDPAKALGTASKTYADLGGLGALLDDLRRAARRSRPRRGGARGRRQALRHRFHRRLRLRLCELVHRLLGVSRDRHARRPGEVRRELVAPADQRGRLHRRADRRADRRQRLSAPRRLAEGGDPPGALHQDRHRHPRRLHRGHRGGQAQPRFARCCCAASRRSSRPI